jgi:tetratricopeptide (TPR) repeat protein
MLFDKVPELDLHLERLSKAQANDLVDFADGNHWELKDFHQLSLDLEEYISTSDLKKPDYSELLYLQAKFCFFGGNLIKLNELYTLTAIEGENPGVQLFYALGLAFQGHTSDSLEILKQVETNDLVVRLEQLGVTLYIYSIKRNNFSVADYFSQMKEFLKKHSKELPDSANAHIMPWAYLRQAYSIRSSGRVFNAIELIKKCQSLLLEYPHRFYQAMILLLLGHCYHNLNNIKLALDFYDQAIDKALETQSWLLLSILYNRVGMAMMAKKKPKLAKKYFQKSVDQAEEAGATWLIIGPLANLAQWKLAEGKVSEAIEDYHQFVEIAAGVGDERELCFAQLTLAELYRGTGDLAKCKYFLSEGFRLALKLGIFRVVNRPEDEANYN